MDAQTFLDNFATIAEAPIGVQRLRGMVIDLALQGRLSDPNPTDDSVDSLIAVIDSDREKAFRANGWRSGKSAGTIRKEELPWPIPDHWAWVRLERLAFPQAGFAFKSDQFNQSGRGMPLIRIRDIGNSTTECHFEGDYREEFIVQAGDYLVGMDGNFNIRQWQGAPALLNQRVTRLIFFGDRMQRSFATWALQDRINALHGSRAYTTVQHLSGRQIAAAVIPLPPLAEQERIVAKVDELMDLCDDLEVRQKRRHRTTTRFRSSALHALTEAETLDDLRYAWERVSANWPALTGSEQSIRDLRQTVLELAVAGHLTATLPDDGTADDLLRSATGLDDPCLVDSEGVALTDPHLLPPAWTWVTLGSVLTEVLAGWSAPSTQQRRASDEWAVLKVSACTWGSFRPEENKALKPGTPPREELEVRAGDLLITRANTSDLVARSVVVGATPPRLMLSDKTLRLTPIQGCNARYLNLANLASVARAHYRAEATGTSDSMKNVSQRAIRRTPIPLPPAPEQDRIVAVVDQLLQLIERLAAALADQTAAAERLTTAATS